MSINDQKSKETKACKELKIDLRARTFRQSDKRRITLETLKLAVALELCLDGYDNVTFNKVIECGSGRVCVHVFAEDAIGSKVAVYCVGRIEEAMGDNLANVVYTITESIGDDCQVAIAIPIDLMNIVDKIADVIYRIYLIDSAGRVWIHDPSRHFSINRTRKLFRLKQKPERENWHPIDANNSVYVKKAQYIV
jgi:hypothetical protein